MVTRVSDMPPEEQAAHYERIRQTLERADEVSAETDAWQAERRADGTEFDEWHQERQRQAEERDRERQRQQAPVVQGRKWVEAIVHETVGAATREWVKERGDAQLQGLAEGLGEELAVIMKRERTLLHQDFEDRIAKSDAATVELLMEMERRLAALEERATLQPPPTRPRLIAGGGSDDVA